MLEALLHKPRSAHSSGAPHVARLQLTCVEAELALSYLRSVRLIFSFSFPGVYIISQILFKTENAMSTGLPNAARSLGPSGAPRQQERLRQLTHFCF